MTTESEIFEEMIEFGINRDTALRAAPLLVQLFSDPRGPKRAIIEDWPREAERLGWLRRQ
jgi:hypothetical protein